MAKGNPLIGNLVLVSIYLLFNYMPFPIGADLITAQCNILKNSGIAPIYGNISLSQQTGNTTVVMKIDLMGFNKSASVTQHGFHVHEHGNLSNNCLAAGAHFNPTNVSHGAPTDAIRHVGDLGNVPVDTNGEVHVYISDNIISLKGDHSIIGLAFVVHETFDDLGKGNFSDSKTTGHAGARYGCCIIQGSAYRLLAESPLQLMALAAFALFISKT